MRLEQGKLNLTYAILKLLENRLDNIEDNTSKSAYVEMFSNCREQGFTIHATVCKPEYKQITIAFSENRNSDNIVVYHSEKFDGYLNEYSEEFWNNKKYFDYNQQFQVAEYISELIENI